jgi:hypothetical protein
LWVCGQPGLDSETLYQKNKQHQKTPDVLEENIYNILQIKGGYSLSKEPWETERHRNKNSIKKRKNKVSRQFSHKQEMYRGGPFLFQATQSELRSLWDQKIQSFLEP